ncbi:unnamed protein product, partial [Mesorhabditis spiculigera]
MSSATEDLEKHVDDVDLEDGELPEEGEIEEDEEQSATTAAPLESTSPTRGEKAGRGGKRSGSFLKERAPFRARLKQSARAVERAAASSAATEKPDPWGPKDPPSPSKLSDDPFGPSDSDFRDGDRDYRYGDEEFGDIDYRAEKRRRRSPSPGSAFGEWNARPFKRMRGGFAPRGRFAGRETQHIVCKFYREGYCRDGEGCSFSHQAEDSLRHPELCKFYKQGFCKKGLACSNLHGEFPCIGYHRGDCHRTDCGFSHLPLTSYTEPIFEKYNAIYYGDDFKPGDEPPPQANPAPAAAIPAPVMPVTTQPALVPRLPPGLTMPPGFPGGPPAGSAPIMPPPPSMILRTASPPPSAINPGPLDAGLSRRRPLLPQPDMPRADMHGAIPAPTVILPQLSAVRSGYSPPPVVPFSAPFRNTPPKHEEPIVPIAPAFDINNVLAQFSQAAAKDSPASPPSSSARPQANASAAAWRLLEVIAPACYSTIDPQVAAQCSQADPRIARVLNSQFDAVTSLISSAVAPSIMRSPLAAPSLVDPRSTSSDPRLRGRTNTAPVDPRAAPAPRSSWMPQMSN